MTAPWVVTWLIAAFIPCAPCVEDTAVLIQQKRTQRAVERDDEASAFEKVFFEESLRILPVPGYLGLSMTQLHTDGEPGGSLALKLNEHCTEGGQSCVYFFGTTVRSWIEVKLTDGFHVGDVLALSFHADIESYNPHSFWAQFLPASFGMDEACSLCEGACTYKKVDEVHYIGLEMPTFLDEPEMCKSLESTEKQEEFVFANMTATWPFPPADLHAVLNTTLGLGVLDKAGAPRAAASYLFRMTQEEPQGAAAMIMQATAVKEDPPISLATLVGKMVFDTVEQGLEVFNASALTNVTQMRAKNPLAERKGGAGHSLTVTLTVKEVEAGTDLSYTIGDNCTKPDRVGSIECTIPLGQVFNYSFLVNSTSSIEEGSTLRFKTSVNVSGVAGMMYAALLPSEEVNVPYCGTTTTITFRGKETTVKLPKCGGYKLEMMSFAPVPQFLADFDDFPLPQMPGLLMPQTTYDQLLPASFTMEAEARHKDGTPMISAVLSFTMTLGD